MSPGQSNLLFQVPARGVSRRSLRQFAFLLEREVAGNRPFVCLVAGDPELRRLNREFRKKDYPTDVLSFPAACGTFPSAADLGEVAISWDRAREQAAEHGHSAEQELQILMLHGVLHLLGMDHETDGGEMARRETRWRRRFGLPCGLIERAHA